MPSSWPIAICLPLFGRLARCAPGRETHTPLSQFHSSAHDSIESTSQRRHSPIHTLNDDVLLNIFYLIQLDIQDQVAIHSIGSNWEWGRRRRWWYKLAQVCRRWRSIIFASPSRLDLHLLCTYGTPVADMLTHSPPLPLTIDYCYKAFVTTVTAKDYKGILLALQHRDRVHHIRLVLPASGLQMVITAMDEPFPILEQMYISSYTRTDHYTTLTLPLPKTIQTPHLRHFALRTVALPLGSLSLLTTVGLVTLVLEDIPSFAYFPPSDLLTHLSLMPQLEKLVTQFRSHPPSLSVEPQLSNASVMTEVTLSHLRTFDFRGVSTYLEGLLAWIRAPLLSNFGVEFLNPNITIPHPLQIIRSANFALSSIELSFRSTGIFLRSRFPELIYHLCTGFFLKTLDWQVSSAVQILSALGPALSTVEMLILCQPRPERYSAVDRTQWRSLLRLFNNVKILYLQDNLVNELARSLRSEGEEIPLDILSNLKELRFSSGGDSGERFHPFIKERQAAGHPVDLREVNLFDFPVSTLPVFIPTSTFAFSHEIPSSHTHTHRCKVCVSTAALSIQPPISTHFAFDPLSSPTMQ
jgi:hypothetical protein